VATWLRGVSAERLAPLMGNAGIRMSVFPHLFEDDMVLPKGGFANADYNAVPLLMLTGTTEFSMFSAFDPFWKSDSLTAWSEDEQAAAKAFAIRYGSDMYRIFNAECSAEEMDSRYGKDIYVCQVAFGSETSAVKIDTFGSFHGIFVPMLSSKNNYTSLVPDTFDKEGYQAMGKAFNAYLKNFLETGNPNGEGLATWDAWDSKKEGKHGVRRNGDRCCHRYGRCPHLIRRDPGSNGCRHDGSRCTQEACCHKRYGRTLVLCSKRCTLWGA
jgi:para-nitrobenzyl esterase